MALSDLLGAGPGAGPGGPPPELALGGGPGGPPAPDQGAGGGDPVALVGEAQDKIRQALQAEPDPEDKLALEDILTKLQKYVTSQQQLVDSVTGAGPGARLLRKSSGGAPAPGL